MPALVPELTHSRACLAHSQELLAHVALIEALADEVDPPFLSCILSIALGPAVIFDDIPQRLILP